MKKKDKMEEWKKLGDRTKHFFVKAFKNEIPMLTSAIMCKGKDWKEIR